MEDICYKELINGFNHERLLSILKQSKYFDYLTRGCPNVSEIYYFTHIIFYLSFFNRVRICKLIQTTFEKYDLYEYILTYIIYCLKINNVDLLTELLICSNLICCSLPNEIVELSKEQIFSFLKISLSKKDTVDSFLEAYHTILLLIMLVNCREK
ncbi:MAG: hypothetical protein Q4Q17_01485 [Tissierellia bacterium]|nr:hypothetical protein [Tissierellia bacterium]